MIDKKKVDATLGDAIHRYLLAMGVETPMIEQPLDATQQKEKIKNSVENILTTLGLDLTDDSLSETPRRVAKMYVDEIFTGLDYKNFPKITTIENKMQYDTMLLERHISVKSECEHHTMPFIGEAFVAYIPSSRVIGLSKINRIVEFFSRRPQVQERLTEQIFHTLCYLLDTDSVAVCIRANHLCVKMRGVEDVNADTITSRLGGSFIEGKLRDEFYQAIKI